MKESDTAPAPPPPKKQRPCVACARSKVKCDNAKPSCSRCVRLGLACVESAPSRRGKRRGKLGEKTASMLLSRQQDAQSDGCGTGDGDCGFDQGGPTMVQLVREVALMATQRGSSMMMTRAMAMATRARISLKDLMLMKSAARVSPAADAPADMAAYLPAGNPFSTMIDGDDDQSDERAAKAARAGGRVSPAPPPLRARPRTGAEAVEMVLRDAPRSLPACIGDFVVAKRDPSSVTLLRMQVDGTVRYQGNRAFDDLVYDSAELNAAMEAQGVGCPSELFLHPDDKPNVCRLLSGVLRRLNAAVPDDDAGTYASSEPDVWPLQLVLKGSGLPMMTRAYLRVVTYHGGRMSFWAWRFDPVAAAAPPEPSLETPGAFATRRLGAAAPLPQTPPEPDLVSEHSRDAAPVSSGDSGDSLDGAPRFDPVVGLGMGMDDATIEAELRSLGDGAFNRQVLGGFLGPTEPPGS